MKQEFDPFLLCPDFNNSHAVVCQLGSRKGSELGLELHVALL